MKFVEAIARMEGFYTEGTRPQRNNNPGDIEAGKFATAHGATGSDGRFAIFPTAEAGFEALTALFNTNGYRDLSIHNAIARYAPSNENDVANYVALVCKWTGLQATNYIKTVL